MKFNPDIILSRQASIRLTCLITLQLVSNLITAQALSARFVRFYIDGNVIIETPLLTTYTRLENFNRERDPRLRVDITDFEVPWLGDSAVTSRVNNTFSGLIFDEKDFISRYSVGTTPVNFPTALGEFKKTGQNELVMDDWPHKFKLTYNNIGQLSRIDETHSRYNDVYDSTNRGTRQIVVTESYCTWHYIYNTNKISRIIADRYWVGQDESGTKEDVTPLKSEFRYNSAGQLISEITYVGKKSPTSPYFSSDSLVELFRRNQYGDDLNNRLQYKNFKLLELTFYKYKNKRLTQIVHWTEENRHISTLGIKYDDIGRIIKAEDQYIRSLYTYNGNRVLERKVQLCLSYGPLDDCDGKQFDEIIERYLYDEQGRIIKVSEEIFTVSDDGKTREKTNHKNAGSILTYFSDK